MGAEPIPDAVRRDPIFRLAGFGLRRWLVIALVAETTAVLLFVPEFRAGTDREATDLQLVGRVIWAIIGVPVGLYLYFWVPIAMSTLIRDLAANGVLVDPEGRQGTVEHSAVDIDRRMDNLLWPALGLLAVGGSFALEIFRLAPDASPTDRAVTMLGVLGTAVAVYTGTVMVLRLVAGVIATSGAIGQAASRVIPLHADEAGGWGGFGQRFFVLARAGLLYGAVAIVVNLATIAAEEDPTTSPASMITLSYFVLLPPLLVWAWFFAPHRAMLEARARVLEPLSQLADGAAAAGLVRGEGHDPAAVVTGSERLEALIHRRDLIVATHPAWPLRLVELRAVWATAFAPVITAIVATVAAMVSGWLDGLV